ncbi:histidine--tRNA ligase [Candidatus Saccharibacteria bacterium]|nr:histidine--tRNA ligase [Candidatus Saccharibacteria bacterium]
MKKFNTSPISGAQELLPAEQAVFNDLKTKIAGSYKSHGYSEIETPSIERTEILLAKAGGDTEKQIYKLIKTTESADDSTQALRFDHTVPLARYIVEHENNLVFPFKVSQIGTNFRGERAQKGRFREFYQCDVDIIGRDKLPIAYDADVIQTLLDTLKLFGLNTPILARISNRKILSGFLEAYNLNQFTTEILDVIDHTEKVPPEKTKSSLEELQLDQDIINRLLTLIDLNGNRESVIDTLESLGLRNDTFITGVKELDQVLSLLEAANLKNEITADLKIVRGLDYYTGTVFEFILPEHKYIGSITGGGRYENLTKHFSDHAFPGVGGSIGLTRLFYVLNEAKLLNHTISTLFDYAIVPISENEFEEAMTVATKLRKNDKTATIIFTDKKLGDKLTYASKITKNAIVVGENEAKTHSYKAKNFATGETTDLDI